MFFLETLFRAARIVLATDHARPLVNARPRRKLFVESPRCALGAEQSPAPRMAEDVRTLSAAQCRFPRGRSVENLPLLATAHFWFTPFESNGPRPAVIAGSGKNRICVGWSSADHAHDGRTRPSYQKGPSRHHLNLIRCPTTSAPPEQHAILPGFRSIGMSLPASSRPPGGPRRQRTLAPPAA